MALGDKIRDLRKERNLTQDELGEKVGIHGRHISRIENDHARPTRKVLKRFAEVFEISVDELTGNDKKRGLSLPDSELSAQFRELSRFDLNEEDKIALKRLLGAMITEKQMQSLLAQKS